MHIFHNYDLIHKFSFEVDISIKNNANLFI